MEFLGKTLILKKKDKKILVVGDLHLGYEGSLNNSGVFVSRELFNEIITEFDNIFGRVGRVNEIILLGDIKHVFGKIIGQEWSDVLDLFDYFKNKCDNVIVVKGNHDKIIEPIIRKVENVEVKDFYYLEEICFLHGDKDFVEIYDKKVKMWILGHGHPAVKIKEPKGVKIEKYKCFLKGNYKGKEIVIVPSFFEGNLGSDPRENDLGLAWNFDFNKFEVLVVGENLEVLDFGMLKNL